MTLTKNIVIWALSRPVARIDFGEVREPTKWTLWTQRVDFLNLTPVNPPTKTPFLAHFVTDSGPFSRFGAVRRTPRTPPPGYGPGAKTLNLAEAVFLLHIYCHLGRRNKVGNESYSGIAFS